MILTEEEIQQLQALEREVDELLTQIAASREIVCRQSLARLENCAGAAAKIAYGTGNPGLISVQMTDLIAWTDHLDDSSWVEQFQQVLARRPLVSPWKR